MTFRRPLPKACPARRRGFGRGVVVVALAAMVSIGWGTPAPAADQATSAVSFRTAILPLLSKAGCNAGACHGAATGQGGFRLSLLGYDPEADHDRITREFGGRRIDVDAPTESLLLRKAAGPLEHEGGRRLPRDSASFRAVRDWIAAGAPRGPRDLRVVRLTVTPADSLLPSAPATVALGAEAELSDGSHAEVTSLALYTSNDDAVAEVGPTGRVAVRGRGVTSIMVRYSGQVAAARIAVPWNDAPAPGTEPDSGKSSDEASSPIDVAVDAELRRLRLPASPPAAPTEFLRRVSLDLAGRLPTPDEVRTFVGEPDTPERRRQVIDRLLADDGFVDLWTLRLGDLLSVGGRRGGEAGARAWHRWLREQVARGTSWNRIAHDLLTAEGDAATVGPANFLLLANDPRDLAEIVGSTFLGTQIACARCHAHPADRWTQTDYHRFAAYFARVTRNGGIVRSSSRGEVDDPKTGHPLAPRPLGADEALAAGNAGASAGAGANGDGDQDGELGVDRRQALAEWVAAPENPFFARAFVNWIWKHLFGRGLVEPVDDLRPTNPPSNPELLEALVRTYRDVDGDLRRFVGALVGTAAYRRSGRVLEGNRGDTRHHSRAQPRELPAEVYLDAVAQVTGVPEHFAGVAEGLRAIQLPGPFVPSPALDLLGRCPRDRRCDSAGAAGGGLAGVLHLVNGATLNRRLAAGTVAQLLQRKESDAGIVGELYLRAFARAPGPEELAHWVEVLGSAPDRAEATQDLLWALLNSREFVFNH